LDRQYSKETRTIDLFERGEGETEKIPTIDSLSDFPSVAGGKTFVACRAASLGTQKNTLDRLSVGGEKKKSRMRRGAMTLSLAKGTSYRKDLTRWRTAGEKKTGAADKGKKALSPILGRPAWADIDYLS